MNPDRTLHAIRVHERGGSDVLAWEAVPEPQPQPGRVVVDVAFAGVNFIDTYHRRGIYPLALPFTPGLEGAGVVVAAGDGAALSPGDRVAWTDQMGSYAERVSIDATRAVPVPEEVGLDVAAATMLQGLTAHYLANDSFPLGDGHRCLVHAGAGGVGLLLIQMAKAAGAEVFTTVSTEAKAELARGAGADHVIRYDEADFGAAIEAVAGPRALDVVYDGVGAATFDRGLTLLRPRGTMVLFGQASGVVAPFDLGRLAAEGSLYVTRPTLFTHVADGSVLARRAGSLFAAIGRGDLSVRIGARFPVERAADAHDALEGRATTGKVLLAVGSAAL